MVAARHVSILQRRELRLDDGDRVQVGQRLPRHRTPQVRVASPQHGRRAARSRCGQSWPSEQSCWAAEQSGRPAEQSGCVREQEAGHFAGRIALGRSRRAANVKPTGGRNGQPACNRSPAERPTNLSRCGLYLFLERLPSISPLSFCGSAGGVPTRHPPSRRTHAHTNTHTQTQTELHMASHAPNHCKQAPPAN